MKRIAWILDTFPSRSETFIARDIQALRARGMAIEVFALHAGEGAHLITKQGTLRTNWKRTGAILGETLSREGFTHVHAGWASHPALIARAAVEAAGLTWSFSAHARDLWVDGGDWEGKLASARFAHCCTRAGATFLQQYADATPVIYAPHGLDLEAWTYQERVGEADVGEKSPFLLGVGRLVPKKGWAVWLQALALMRDSAPDVTFRAAIIGEGPQEAALRRQANALQLEKQVQWRGALPVEDVRGAMQQAQLLVFSGLIAPDGDRDGLPNVLLEAAALGLPIVATRAGCVEEFGPGALWLCEPGDAPALAAAMLHALREWPASKAQARRARQIVEKRFAQSNAIAPLAAAFERVLNM